MKTKKLLATLMVYSSVLCSMEMMAQEQDSHFINHEINRDSWLVTASGFRNNGQSPEKVKDGRVNTRWTTGNFQKGDEWIQLDLGAQKPFNEIELFQANSVKDYPRSYEVYVSKDGENWGEPIAKGMGTEGQATIIRLHSKITARYLKVKQTGSSKGNWWSLHELYLRNK